MNSQPMQLSQPQQQNYATQHSRMSVPSQPMPTEPVDLDDSGIGMGLMDDDLALSKYGINTAHVGHDMVGGDMGVNVL